MDRDRIRNGLTAAIDGAARGCAVASDLCSACVDLLDVDGAGLWLTTAGFTGRSLSTGGAVTADLDSRQLTAGEGPCWDAVRFSSLVTAPDLRGVDSQRWPGFAAAAAELDIRSVFAMPAMVAGVPVGVLYLCRSSAGPLTGSALTGALLAAELAVLPLLDVLADTRGLPVPDLPPTTRRNLGSLNRAEVYQAVGMISAQLGVHPAEAMLRLRAHAFATDMTASQVAYLIIERRLELEDDGTGSAEWRAGDFWPDWRDEL